MIRFDVSSLREVTEQTVEQLTNALDEPALRAITFAGAEVFREEAKRNALSHKKTGILYNNIIVKRIEEESDGSKRQVYLVTVRAGRYGGGDAYYWRWVEGGHKFVPRKNQGTSWKAHRAAATLEYGTASAPAYPFMRPAYESRKGAAMDAMTEKLREQLERNGTR